MKHLPNALTLTNLCLGCLGIYFVLEGQYGFTLLCMLGSQLADFLDGFAARLLKATSPIGKQLDSLADMVSFGVLPGFIAYSLIQAEQGSDQLGIWVLALPICAALRLARFNIDESQGTSFVGLPTPAAALFFGGLLAVFHFEMSWVQWLSPAVVAVSSVLIALLMVSPFRLFSLKLKSFAIKSNLPLYTWILVCLLLAIWLKFAVIPVSILLYVLLSIVFKYTPWNSSLK